MPLTLDEVRELMANPSSLSPAQAPVLQPTDSRFAIAVLDRGFVYVGHIDDHGEWFVIRDARNIRRWGTTKGLGELAAEGPRDNTTLDPAGTVRVPRHSLVLFLDTEVDLWVSK